MKSWKRLFMMPRAYFMEAVDQRSRSLHHSCTHGWAALGSLGSGSSKSILSPLKAPCSSCGDKIIDAKLFSLAHSVILMTFAGRRALALLSPPGGTNVPQDEYEAQSKRMTEQNKLFDAARDSCLESLSRLRRRCQSMPADSIKKGNGGDYPLGELVQDLYSTETPRVMATDPRDRIFALLGLCTDRGELEISTDYTDAQTIDLVYNQASRAILGSKGGIRLLELPRFPKTVIGHGGVADEAAAKRLPSWVPGFKHHPRSFARSLAEASRNQWLYSPVGKLPKAEIIINSSGDLRILSLRGILVDSICFTNETWKGAIPAGSKDAGHGFYLHYFTEVEELYGISPDKPRGKLPNDTPRDELAYRVMLGDAIYEHNS